MKAIVMAAGKGSRISELTNGKPKSFLKINGEELIVRAVRQLTSRGIEEIIVVTGYEEQQVRNLLGQRVTYVHNPLFGQTNVLASFFCAAQQVDDDCIFLHADTVFKDEVLDSLISNAGTEGDSVLMAVEFGETDEEAMKVELFPESNNQIQHINKTMALSSSAGEFIGLAYLPKKALGKLSLSASKLLDNGEFKEYFEAAVQDYLNFGEGKALSVPVESGSWVEVDFVEDYRRAESFFNSSSEVEALE